MPKTFSDYALEKLADIMNSHSDHVGSELKASDPTKYKDKVASDCITMALWVLAYAFEQQGEAAIAKKVRRMGNNGTELSNYLIDQRGWKGVYYNPDVNHPSDGSGEHIFSYYQQVRKKCSYSVAVVPVSYKVINYAPSKKKVTSYLPLTKRDAVDFYIFNTVPFGLGMSRGGEHVWLYSNGYVYESHWDREPSTGLYTSVPLGRFPWRSGIVVVPPDKHHLLSMSKVVCK